MASLSNDRGNLRVKFRLPGSSEQIREPLGIKATKDNWAWARRAVLKPLERALAARDYAELLRLFPDSLRLKTSSLAPAPILTLGEFARMRWLKEMAAGAGQSQKLSTLVSYEVILRRWLEGCPVMQRPLAELAPTDGAEFAAWLARQPGSMVMRHRALRQLGRILKRAKELGLLPDGSNPLLGIKGFKDADRDAEREGDLGAWTAEERDRLIAAAHAIAPWQGTVTEVAFFTGMRRGEVFGLKWSDLDFERCEICVRRSIVQNPIHPGTPLARLMEWDRTLSGTQVESSPKTTGSRAVIQMLPCVRKALLGQRQRLGLTSLWVFPDEENADKAFQVETFAKHRWPRIVAAAGVPERAFKQTRHTFAVLALEAGGEGQLIWVQRMLRHQSSQMLVNHYLKHARPAAPSAEFVERFGAGPGGAGPLLGHSTDETEEKSMKSSSWSRRRATRNPN